MRIVRAELHKLAGAPWVLGFAVLCVLLNGALVATVSSNDSYDDGVGRAADQAGTQIDDRFVATAGPLSSSLKADVASLTDSFSYDYPALGERYVAAIHADGIVADALRSKYALAASTAVDLSNQQAAKSLYLGADSTGFHRQIFGTVLGAAAMESFIFATLFGIQSFGIEHARRTNSILFSSRVGRRLAGAKVLAAAILTIAASVLLTTTAWLAIGLRFPVIATSSSFVNSGFNQLYDPISSWRPFLTWDAMTLPVYAAAFAIIVTGLALAFSFGASALAMVVREPYIAFGVLLLADVCLFAAPFFFPSASLAAYVTSLSPIWLWANSNSWFTDGGYFAIWPHYETIGTIAAGLIAVIFALAACMRFSRKDIA